MSWYLEVLKKYAVFSGRARRREYWMFVLINIVISIALSIVEALAGGPGILSIIYGLAVLIPSLAVSVRRLHDIGKSGWWALIGLIPLIGAVVLIIFALQDSQAGSNQYGPTPKAAAA